MEADPSDLCANARPPEEHSHFFTADGQFGSLDAEGNQVDASTYVIVDQDTLSIGSAGAPSGVLVDYAVEGDSATFKVTIPDDCAADCLEAYAGALSAFYDGDPWVRADS
jgi:hypothetical protein